MLKDVTKYGHEDVNQNVPDNMFDMLVVEFQTQRKDGQLSLVNSEVKKMLVQISEYETGAKANVWDIMSTMKRKVDGKIILVYVYSAHMDNVSFHSEASVQKWKYVVQREIAFERELGK